MIELQNTELECLRWLCKDKEDVPLLSCLQGIIGRVWADRKAEPEIALVLVADFCYLIGHVVDNKVEKLLFEVLQNCKGKIIIVEDISWVKLLEKYFPNNLNRFIRYSMKKELDTFNKNELINFINSTETNFKIQKIDKSIYNKALQDEFMADCCSYFMDYEEYYEHGIGFAILYNEEIIAAASSYCYCEGEIEVTIGTKPEYRRNGLAAGCASKLILHCLENNIYPRWEAANVESVALAEKLGYHFNKEFQVYRIV